MLSIMLPAIRIEEELLPAAEIHLEHSLVSLSKWESIHEKAFFGSGLKDPWTAEETLSYIKQMLLNDPPPRWIERLQLEDYTTITDYINSSQTATWFREEQNQKSSREVVTNELIYYWMLSLQIPFEPCQNWHVNRLMTLIKICGIKQTKPKKMSRSAQAREYARLNAERRAALGTHG